MWSPSCIRAEIAAILGARSASKQPTDQHIGSAESAKTSSNIDGLNLCQMNTTRNALISAHKAARQSRTTQAIYSTRNRLRNATHAMLAKEQGKDWP
tara:strand:- start:587 stop:877 length:291 start_codon:yes stop_codon:yes gene_type:complete